MITPRVNKLLGQVARLTLLAETFSTSCRALAVLLISMLLAVAIDVVASLEPWALICLDLALVALVLGGLVYIGWVAYHNRYDARRLARLIENRLQLGGNRLINSVDLAVKSKHPDSQKLRAEAISRGESLAGTSAPAKLIDSRRLKSAVLTGGIAVLLTVASLLTVPGVFRAVLPRFLHPGSDYPPFTLLNFEVQIDPEKIYHSKPAVITAVLSGMSTLPDQANAVFVELDNSKRKSLPMMRSASGEFVLRIDRTERSGQFYIDTPAGRSGRYKLTVHPVPRFELVQLKYEYPAYTHWPASRTVLGKDNNLRAIEGTRLTITVSSNLPLSEGKMVLTGSNQDQEHTEVLLEPTDEDPLQVRGSFQISRSCSYEISLRSAQGVPGDQNLHGTVTSVPDAHPQVEFLEPDQVVVAPVNWKVPVEIAAQDDVGVERILIFRAINGWSPNSVELEKKESGPSYAQSKYIFDLPLLGVRPGDVISYYASAYDNNPSAEHFTDTAAFVIRVIDEEEYLNYARASYRIDDLMRELNEFRDQIEALDQQRKELLKEAEALAEKIAQGDQQLSKEELESLKQFAQAQQEYASKAQALAEQIRERLKMPDLYEFEKPFKEMLKGMAENLQGQSKRNKELTNGS